MIIGGYTLHLYCDDEGHADKYPDEDNAPTEMGEYSGNNAGATRRLARRAGWGVDLKNDKATCPACRRRHRKKKR